MSSSSGRKPPKDARVPDLQEVGDINSVVGKGGSKLKTETYGRPQTGAEESGQGKAFCHPAGDVSH